MWGRWPPRGVSGPPPPRPRERGDQRPPPDSPDASKHPEEARNSRMVPAKAAHWGKDWVKNPLQAVPKSSRAGNRPASGCASTPRSAGHRARNGKGRTRGRSTGNQPRYLRNRSRITRQTGKFVSRNLLLPAGSPRTNGRLRALRHPAEALTDRRFIDRVDVGYVKGLLHGCLLHIRGPWPNVHFYRRAAVCIFGQVICLLINSWNTPSTSLSSLKVPL